MKRKQREARNQTKEKDRKNRVRLLLIQFGVWVELKTFPSWEKTYCLPIRVVCHDPRDERTESVRSDLESAAWDATFDCPLLGNDYPVQDYWMYVKPIAHQLRGILVMRTGSHILRAKLKKLEPLMKQEVAASALNRLCGSYLGPTLSKHSRIDDRQFHLRMDIVQKEYRRELRLVLGETESEQRTAIVDGEARTVFRCGHGGFAGDVEWLEWPASALNLVENRTYPVFVQRHALRKLYARLAPLLAATSHTKEWEGLHDSWFFESLRQPIVRPSPRNDGHFLVDFLVQGFKVGYVVVCKADDMILVKTFLLLTMDDTPEGIELRKQLRLRRSDKEFLRLDDLSTFIVEDLALDPELTEIFAECGCGDLFQLRDLLDVQEVKTGAASALRKFLGLGEVRRLSAIDMISSALADSINEP